MEDADQYMARLKMESAESWREWLDSIPAIKIPEGFTVQPCPPFGGAIARMVLFSPSGKRVSVYLDVWNRLGYGPGPYWEVYPSKIATEGWDVWRCPMEDAEALSAAILQSATDQDFEGQ